MGVSFSDSPRVSEVMAKTLYGIRHAACMARQALRRKRNAPLNFSNLGLEFGTYVIRICGEVMPIFVTPFV